MSALAETLDLSKYIDRHLMGERPHIRGRRIPVAVIAHFRAANSWTIEETAYNYDLSEAEVLAALLYYAENRSAIELQEAEERRLFEEAKQKHD